MIVCCTAILNIYVFLYCNVRFSGLDFAVVGIVLASFASKANGSGQVEFLPAQRVAPGKWDKFGIPVGRKFKILWTWASSSCAIG